MGAKEDPELDMGNARADDLFDGSAGPATAAARAARAIDQAHRDAVAAGEPGYRDPLTGFMVFTARFHSDRGYCCDNGCRHCPYPASTDLPE